MTELKGKIDFTAFVAATNANPNGDPLNGNRPRTDLDGYGEISDVCIKRKIRNRLQDMGQKVFVQSDDRSDDGCKSLKDRAKKCEKLDNELKKSKPDKDAFAKIACGEWIDVRSFGQVFAFKKEGGKKNANNEKSNGVSIGIRGPVSIWQAKSLSPVEISSMQITKSVNGDETDGKGSDTMGTKHMVNFAVYKIVGSVNVQLAEKTGFSQEDADLLKKALETLFENDASSSRPEGSMEVRKLYWWQHEEKTPAVSSAKIQRGFKINTVDNPKSFEEYDIDWYVDGCVEPEIEEF